jgi:hypothetical protein
VAILQFPFKIAKREISLPLDQEPINSQQSMLVKSSSSFLIGKTRERFVALQNAIVPRSRDFDADQSSRSDELVEGMLSDQPRMIRFKIALFLFVIDCVSILFGRRTFRKLDPHRQERVLRFFFDSPVALFRKGFWGVSALAKLGAYGQSSVYRDIGYELKETPR